MAGMARRGSRGAHSARHRAGRSQPDVARRHAQAAADGPGPEADEHADFWPGSNAQAEFGPGTADLAGFDPPGGHDEFGPAPAARPAPPATPPSRTPPPPQS